MCKICKLIKSHKLLPDKRAETMDRNYRLFRLHGRPVYRGDVLVSSYEGEDFYIILLSQSRQDLKERGLLILDVTNQKIVKIENIRKSLQDYQYVGHYWQSEVRELLEGYENAWN